MASPATATPGKTRIGWIGTGVMGRWMCQHAMTAGYAATVYNRSKDKAQPLIDEHFRTVLRFVPKVAPVKAAVFPLKRNHDGLVGTAKDIAGKVQQKTGEITGSTSQQVKGVANYSRTDNPPQAGDRIELGAYGNSGEASRAP